MFETAVLSGGPQGKRVWTTFLGFGGQALLLGGLVLAPLVSPQVMPRVVWTMQLAPPSPPAAPPAPAGAQIIPRTHAVATHALGIFVAPDKVPSTVRIIDDLDQVAAATFVQGGMPGARIAGAASNLVSDIIGAVGRVVPNYRPEAPPKPVAAPAPVAAKPPRIAELQMAEPIQRVNPIYPSMARAVRVSGKVELMGVLGIDGRIHELRVLSGHPLLVKAAVDAVMQWVYRPTILNGQAVEVQAPITVNFILN